MTNKTNKTLYEGLRPLIVWLGLGRLSVRPWIMVTSGAGRTGTAAAVNRCPSKSIETLEIVVTTAWY